MGGGTVFGPKPRSFAQRMPRKMRRLALRSALTIKATEGKVSVIKAGAQWEVLRVNDLGDDCFATPAIVEDRIYIRTRSRLYCFANLAAPNPAGDR